MLSTKGGKQSTKHIKHVSRTNLCNLSIKQEIAFMYPPTPQLQQLFKWKLYSYYFQFPRHRQMFTSHYFQDDKNRYPSSLLKMFHVIQRWPFSYQCAKSVHDYKQITGSVYAFTTESLCSLIEIKLTFNLRGPMHSDAALVWILVWPSRRQAITRTNVDLLHHATISQTFHGILFLILCHQNVCVIKINIKTCACHG